MDKSQIKTYSYGLLTLKHWVAWYPVKQQIVCNIILFFGGGVILTVEIINLPKICLPRCTYQARWILKITEKVPSSNLGSDIYFPD